MSKPLSPVEEARGVYPSVEGLRLGVNGAPRQATEVSGPRPPLLIGVCGQSASGKSTVCARIRSELLAHADVVVLPLDSFYKTPPAGTDISSYDFDHPDSLDFDEFVVALDNLSNGLPARIPEYSFVEHRRVGYHDMQPASVIITDGILLFTDKRVTQRLHVKIFVDTDADECLRRRILRDTKDRGRDLNGVLEQYCRFVRPSVERFVAPSRVEADIVIPRGYNPIAVDLIKASLVQKLSMSGDDVGVRYPQVRIVGHSLTVKSIHSAIRDSTIHTRDFVFYTDRLTRIVLEFAMGMAAASSNSVMDRSVVTPDGHTYEGVSGICGGPACADDLAVVSVVRAGEAMEAAVRQLVPGVPVGKILLQTKPKAATTDSSAAPIGVDSDDEFAVRYCKLPVDITKAKTVLVLEPVIGDGRATAAAVRLLRARGVPEKALLIVSLIGSQRGLESLARAFPGISIVSSEIDPRVDEQGRCVPGIGDIAERYFGSRESR